MRIFNNYFFHSKWDLIWKSHCEPGENVNKNSWFTEKMVHIILGYDKFWIKMLNKFTFIKKKLNFKVLFFNISMVHIILVHKILKINMKTNYFKISPWNRIIWASNLIFYREPRFFGSHNSGSPILIFFSPWFT